MGRLGKPSKKRVGNIRLGSKFRMELTGHEPRMIGEFNDLNQVSFGMNPADAQTVLFKRSAMGVVKFIPMTMPLLNLGLRIGFLRR